MPKKNTDESQADQSKRFEEAVDELEAAGELNRTEADEVFELAVRTIVPTNSKKA